MNGKPGPSLFAEENEGLGVLLQKFNIQETYAYGRIDVLPLLLFLTVAVE